MRFELASSDALPRLAWAARLRRGDPVVRVEHGAQVETWDGGFVEGAWDGPFAERGFLHSATLAGSGGVVAQEGVVFAAPANMYERLYSLRVGEVLTVSNSLAFLLARCGERLDPDHPHYYLDLLDFYRCGIRVKQKHLRLVGGRRAELHDCCNLAVGPDLGLARREKPWGPPPEDYAGYVRQLEDALRRTVENAGDAGRRRRYRPLAMLSQGYDSTAVAALARRVGCSEAVTFLRSNSHEGYTDDSGEEIGRSLGYEVTAYERNDTRDLPDFREEEFYLEPWGVDRTMAVMETQLAGALLLSGRAGETVWSRGDPRWGRPDLEHPHDLLAGCALVEFRLRVGFLHFPPATVAAIHAPRIHAWNASPALRAWSIGGGYDKPIARRIAEEAGVPRHLFGQVNKGGPERPPPDDWSLGARLRRLLERTSQRRHVRFRVPSALARRLHRRWREGSFEIQRGCERMVERYRRAAPRPSEDARAGRSVA